MGAEHAAGITIGLLAAGMLVAAFVYASVGHGGASAYGLVIAVQGDQRLFNQYGVILVHLANHPQVKKDLGQAFVDWIVSREWQAAIAAYKIGGEQLFFPSAKG